MYGENYSKFEPCKRGKNINLTNNQIKKSIIEAPIEGQITKIGYDVGEQTSLNKNVIHLLSQIYLIIKL